MLNDTWVSVPTGSEDFTFKNMRRNQYVEELFKCEDQMFELDMVIDSNVATIKALEPLEQEIDLLKKKEDRQNTAPNASLNAGIFGSKIHYKLDKRSLSTVRGEPY